MDMKANHLIILSLLFCCSIGCNPNKSKSGANPQLTQNDDIRPNQKALVKKGMDALFKDFDEATVREVFATDYIQHNPNVATGLEPVIALLPILKDAGFGYDTYRIIEDGDLVLTHTAYHNAKIFGAEEVIAFDIWRIEADRIVEHWDAIIPKYEVTASGRSQIDGITQLTDLDKTQENKDFVAIFVNEALIKEDFSVMGDFIKNGLYDQHNPMVKDGPKALQEVIAVSGLKNHKIHRIIGEGNFVLTQCEGLWNGKPQAIYDLFRIHNGAIIEHWDVIQEIPDQMAHTNTMF